MVSFHNGSRLLPEGIIIDRTGRREQFQESRWITIDGDDFAVETASDDFDGYWYDSGKVYVMRDRAPVLVTVEITLIDGSRISPDGTFVLKDGTHNRLSEGQRISKEGKPVAGRSHTAEKTPAAPVTSAAPAAPTAPAKQATPATPIDASHKTEGTVKPHQPEEHEKGQAPEKKQDPK